jgi:hypothetical protein
LIERRNGQQILWSFDCDRNMKFILLNVENEINYLLLICRKILEWNVHKLQSFVNTASPEQISPRLHHRYMKYFNPDICLEYFCIALNTAYTRVDANSVSVAIDLYW